MSSTKSFRRDFCFVVCASILWGTVGVATQFLYAHGVGNALSIAFLRLALAAPLFFLAGWFVLKRRLFQIQWRDLLVMGAMGGMQALYQASYNTAIAYAGVTISTLIALCGAPVMIALFSTFIMRERLTPLMLLALVSALAGTVLLVVARARSGAETLSLLGVFFAFLSACGYASFILWGRMLSKRCHPLQINTVAFAVGALLLCFSASSGGALTAFPAWAWLVLIYLGCVPTAIAYGLFQAGMRSLSATMGSIVTLCEALTAALLAWVMFHEALGLSGLLGAVLLLAAMLLLIRRT